MKDLISVIINVYNGEKYIKKCLDSVVNQTYNNLEILIINDGSTDDTLSICNAYKDSRIKIITTENLGLSLSRNVGIENASGKYFYFIDADDYIENDTIEYLYNLLKKYDCDISFSSHLNIYNYKVKKRNKKEKINVLFKEDMLKMVIIDSVTIWNKLMKKEMFNNIKFPNEIIEDVRTTYKLILNSKKGVYSNQIKYMRLIHKDSIIGKKDRDILIDIYNARLERYRYIKKIYPNLIENDISILLLIINTYVSDNEDTIRYIGIGNLKKLYKSLFKIKILNSDISFKNKFKLILFRISPFIYKSVFRIYIEIKSNIKGKI